MSLILHSWATSRISFPWVVFNYNCVTSNIEFSHLFLVRRKNCTFSYIFIKINTEFSIMLFSRFLKDRQFQWPKDGLSSKPLHKTNPTESYQALWINRLDNFIVCTEFSVQTIPSSLEIYDLEEISRIKPLKFQT